MDRLTSTSTTTTTSPSPIPTIETTSAAVPPMTSPIASRRSIRANSMQPSPDRMPSGSPNPSSVFGLERNSEESHLEALAAAQAEHERVRKAAIQAYELHELRRETQRILEEQQKQEERIKAEHKVIEEEKRLRALRATQVPRPPPEPPRPAPVAAPAPKPAEAPAAAAPPAQVNGAQQQQQQQPQAANPFSTTPRAAVPTASVGQTQPQAQGQTQPKPSSINGLLNPAQAPALATNNVPKPAAAPATDRYLEIHKALKTLRQQLAQQAKTPGSQLNAKFGEMRRMVRRSVGQLTTEKAANAQTTARVLELLRTALNGTVQSPPADVAPYTVDPREPAEGAARNDPTLPSLFLYLVNVFAKSIIRQFIDECGANPAAADPIGVATASVFSQPDFQWRGKSLVDILMAKFRVVCPVLFGQRGKDTTEQGRLRVGWWRENGGWITEQMHNDRMTGLGAGFAAIALRKFGRVARQNPYPPSNYWKAMAGILNTPAAEVSATQYIVLKSMIQGYEDRFLEFFGNAALAALRLALVEFPTRAPPKAQSQAMTLSVLGDVLRKDRGLALPA